MDRAKAIGIAPVLVVADVVETAEYYKTVLGFNLINYFLDPPVYAMVERNGCQIHFAQSHTGDIKPNNTGNGMASDFIIWVPEIEAFYNELNSQNAIIVQSIVMRSYGREFIVQDCNGYRILVCD